MFELVSEDRQRKSTVLQIIRKSSYCQAHFDRLHLFAAARQRYLGVDTLKELFEKVESRNIVAFIKDTNFYHCI